MKQVININFHGQVVPIEVSAFDLLKNYTASLAKFFANEEGKEEIINDIESRIGELFQERLKKGATCITDEDVNAIIQNMGRPEEFDGEEEKVASSLGSSSEKTNTNDYGQTQETQKRLYRDENNKVIGGVCGGIARYFGTDPIIIRIIFVLLAFAGAGILAYFILWVAVPSTAAKEIGGVRKKLFRDPDDKWIGGVCSGLGNYFGVSPWIPRALFLIPFLSIAFRWHEWGVIDFPSFISLSFSPGSLIIYIILWLVIPEASSTAEKLQMKGEKVDMNSIKNSVVEEMKGVQQRAEKFAKEASAVASEKGQQLGSEIKTVAKKSGRSFGDVILLLIKIFAYFIIGSIVFSLVVALFVFAIFSVGIFPLKDYILTEGWQNVLAWGTLIFFIAVPVIGVITWIIRRLAKMRNNSKVLTASFICLWVLGWVCFISLFASTVKNFRRVNNTKEEEIALINPVVNKLELTAEDDGDGDNYRYNSFRLEAFEGLEEDTAYVKNVDVKIKKSLTDSFKVTIKKIANGRTKDIAYASAAQILYRGIQKDSLLVFDRGIAINKHDKFRNQRVVITVYVPVGKQIRVGGSVGWGNNVHFTGPWNDDDWYDDRNAEEKGWHENETYIMKADGLYTLKGKPADERKHQEEEETDDDNSGEKNTAPATNDPYRYNNTAAPKADSLQQKQTDDIKHKADSLRKEADKLEGKKQTAMIKKSETPVITSYQMPLFIHL